MVKMCVSYKMAATELSPFIFPTKVSHVDYPNWVCTGGGFWEIEFSLPKLTHYSATTVRYLSCLLLLVTNNTVT